MKTGILSPNFPFLKLSIFFLQIMNTVTLTYEHVEEDGPPNWWVLNWICLGESLLNVSCYLQMWSAFALFVVASDFFFCFS